jgi:hypothetical protein
MRQLPLIEPGKGGSSPETTFVKPAESSKPESPIMTERLMEAAKATDRLLDFLPPLDVGNPETFIAGITAIFASYPLEVIALAVDPVKGIPSRTDRPTLKLITDVCDEIYDPIRRRQEYDERERARAAAPVLLPRPPRSAEQQAEIDAQVAAARAAIGIPLDGLVRRPVYLPPSSDAAYGAAVPRTLDDGNHARRIAADLAARAARNKTSQQQDEDHEHGSS